MRPPVEVGRVVIGKAGRDKGRELLVVGLPEENYALLCDGVTRKWAKPKRKKIMHLRPTQRLAKDLAGRIQAGEQILDSDIRKALAQPEQSPLEEV